jgi:predicted transposase YbfD/YdcC
LSHQKKVGALPVAGSDEVKQTNEIGMVCAVLDVLDIAGKTLTADALLTQRTLARYARDRGAHYVFTVKGNQPNLLEDIRLLFENRGAPDYQEAPAIRHGRFEQRAIWVSDRLNDYLDFPDVGQVFAIERQRIDKKSGKGRDQPEIVFGITSHTTASPAAILAYNRGHWGIESHHYVLDWNWDEDRCTVRTGYGPENLSALRRFAIGLIQAKSRDTVASTLQRLARSPRMLLDYLRLSRNALPRTSCAAT